MDIGTGIVLFGIWLFACVCSWKSFEILSKMDTLSFMVAIAFTIGMMIVSNLHIGG